MQPTRPGSLTVADFAKTLRRESAVSQRPQRQGTTIGIVTLASFTPGRRVAYWHALVSTLRPIEFKKSKRRRNSGPVSTPAGGSLETHDRHEQSADCRRFESRRHEAPNTNQDSSTALAKAIDGNAADTISCSWGEWSSAIWPRRAIS